MSFVFYNMDYRKIYVCLIETRRTTPTEDSYYEHHHIVPKSEGGSDGERNIVKLTAREHYIAHLLLAKIYDDYAMHSAVVFMQTGRHKGRDFKFNSHLYDKIRRLVGEKQKGRYVSASTRLKLSLSHKGKTTWIKGKHLSEEARQKIAKSRLGKKPSDEVRLKLRNSIRGLRYWNNGVKNVRARECPEGFVSGRLCRSK